MERYMNARRGAAIASSVGTGWMRSPQLTEPLFAAHRLYSLASLVISSTPIGALTSAGSRPGTGEGTRMTPVSRCSWASTSPTSLPVMSRSCALTFMALSHVVLDDVVVSIVEQRPDGIGRAPPDGRDARPGGVLAHLGVDGNSVVDGVELDPTVETDRDHEARDGVLRLGRDVHVAEAHAHDRHRPVPPNRRLPRLGRRRGLRGAVEVQAVGAPHHLDAPRIAAPEAARWKRPRRGVRSEGHVLTPGDGLILRARTAVGAGHAGALVVVSVRLAGLLGPLATRVLQIPLLDLDDPLVPTLSLGRHQRASILERTTSANLALAWAYIETK